MQDEQDSKLGTQGAEEPSFYHEADDNQSAGAVLPFGNEQSVSWTASEYIAHHKGAGWYVMLAVATALFSALAYLIVRDTLTIAAIVVVAISFGFFGSRPPRTLDYGIDARGITIGDKIYPYSILRTFSIQHEGALSSIVLIPLKRFMPAISVYYPPDQEAEIINTLSGYLPHEERPPDPIEKLMRHIRF